MHQDDDDHQWQRDAKLPVWRGWHAFRRGLATNLHRLGVSDKVTQTILRHSNVAVTQTHYVKMVGADAKAAMNTLQESIENSSIRRTADSPVFRTTYERQ